MFVEDANILLHESYPGDQYVLRVQAPKCAAHAVPGSFAHIQCGPELPMRRPLSIMRAHANAGWVEFLYKDVGIGTHELSRRSAGEVISLIGPIGTNPDNLFDKLAGACPVGPCSAVRTHTVVKSMCAATLGSAAMLVQ